MKRFKHLPIVLILLLGSLGVEATTWAEDQETLNQGLRMAAISGTIPQIEQWLKRGAQIDGQAQHGESALEYALRFGRYGAALRLLVRGANPNAEDDSGLTPLLRAASECNASRVVEKLLSRGADINHADLYGRTPLIQAVHLGCPRTVAVLLLRGKDKINIDARDDSLQTAEDYARPGIVTQMLELARSYQRRGSVEDLEHLQALR